MSFKTLIELLLGKSKDKDIICNKHRTKKLFFTGHEELSISSKANATAKDVDKMAYNILQKYKDKPELILKFIESKGTKIVVAPNLLPIIKFLGYEEGFIPSHNNLKAFILNILFNKASKEKMTFSTELQDTLLICRKELSLYFLAYQFHHWLSYQYKLPGYDYETMYLFKSTMNTNANLSALSINQILSIKDAIERDKQAIDFVTNFVKEQVGAKSCVENIANGKAVKI